MLNDWVTGWRNWRAFIAGGLIMIGLTGRAFAGGGPCNYLLLYDDKDINSIAVANYYQQLRGIPERNMVPYTFFPTNMTSYTQQDLWNLTLYLRQVIQDRGLTGRFNGIAVAGTVPLLGSSNQLGFQSGLFYSPGFTSWGQFSNSYDNLAFAIPPGQETCEIRDDKPYINGTTTNVYWPVAFVGFTGVNGNTPEEVFKLLDRSKAADGLRPDGVVYWPTNGDIRSDVRIPQINDVRAIWNARGIRYSVYADRIPSGCPDIAGAVVGDMRADVGISGNKYVPGAWVDHLTSNGGNLNYLHNHQTSASAWLRAGAYGSSGTAAEPGASDYKFPHAAIHTHLRAGATMAEAFWQSVRTPVEIVMLGDPLLQAWAHIPQVVITSPANGATLGGMVTITVSASTTCPDGLEVRHELAVDGHIVRSNDTISATWTNSGFMLDTTTLADGWHDLRVIACNNNAIHTQGEARRSVFVNNAGQSITLTGPGSLDYASTTTSAFTVTLTGISTATNVTLQANGRTLAANVTGSVSLPASVFGWQGVTKVYAVAWLGNGRQIWSAPLDVNLGWTMNPCTNVTPGAAIAQLRYFSNTTVSNFNWDTTPPDAVTNYPGPVLDGTVIKYRSFRLSTNDLPAYVPTSYANLPGFDATMVFLAPTNGLYEFIIRERSLTNILIDVDGQPIQYGVSTSDRNIKPAPVKLAAGFHPVRVRFRFTAGNYLPEFFFRGGSSSGNLNVNYGIYASYDYLIVSRMNEVVCFGPAIPGNTAPAITNGPGLPTTPPRSSTTTNLYVGATDPDSGPQPLMYSWAKIDGPGQVTVTTNASSTSFTNVATFTRAGTYRIRTMVSDGAAIATGEVVAVVNPVYTTVYLSPVSTDIRIGTSLQLYALQRDQFSTYYNDRPFAWTISGGGSITSNGLYTAPATPGTNYITASVGAYKASNTVIVVNNYPPTINSLQLTDYGDYLRCTVDADDDMGTNNLTCAWEAFGAPPGAMTFAANGTGANPSDGYYTRFGLYSLRVGVTDSSGATTWSGTNIITWPGPTKNTVWVGPTLNKVILTDANGNGVLDRNECGELTVLLNRDDAGSSGGSATLVVTNVPGVTVVQPMSAFSIPGGAPGSIVTNLVPFRVNADTSVACDMWRAFVLQVTIDGASGEVPFTLSPATGYLMTRTMGASIVPGTTDVGVHGQYACGTNVVLPFAYTFGDRSYSNVFVNSNGILQFAGQDVDVPYGYLPYDGWTDFIAVHWAPLRTDLPGGGIFTSVSGTAPNRIVNIEWHAVRDDNTNDVINCEARLHENQPRVDLIYGTVGGNGGNAMVGVQQTMDAYTLYSSYEPLLTNGLQLSFVLQTNCLATTGPCDCDADDLPDVWMLQHFGHPTGHSNDFSLAQQDADGDGMSNGQEYIAGTDPRDAASYLKVGGLTRGGNDFLLRFPTVSGKTYGVLCCDDLSAGWTNVVADNVSGTGGEVEIQDPGAALLPRRFYRLIVLP
jgi:uncharacterized protein (TIGR03790 family)